MTTMTTQYSTNPPLASPTLFNQHYSGGVQYNPNPKGAINAKANATADANANATANVSGSPSSSVSPPSPHSAYLSQHFAQPSQMRPPKTPLYIPAVLRPTEKPVRNSPPKNGRDSLDSPKSLLTPTDRLGTAGSFESGNINRVITEDWSDESLGKVTGPPTRDHWKPDPSSPKCTSPSCTTTFSLLSRRHHCRRCGNLFCASHSSTTVPLDQHARFHPDGTVQRACDTCYRDYQAWLVMRDGSRSNSAGSSSVNSESPTTARMEVPSRAGSGAQQLQPPQQQHAGWAQKVGSLAQSVPRDWSWSTF